VAWLKNRIQGGDALAQRYLDEQRQS
jgi:hypothetical protein